MPILITGGAGYIGSHTVKYFQKQNEEIIVVDNMQSGHETSINVGHLYRVDIRDKEELAKVFKKHNIEAVIHFAANSLVGESMEKPYEYYHNNVFGMLCLLDVMKENNVNKMVFSSTAATYGEPKSIPIMESKLFVSFYRKYKFSKDKVDRFMSLGIMCFMVGFVIGSMSSSSNIGSQWLWVFWGVAVAYQGIVLKPNNRLE